MLDIIIVAQKTWQIVIGIRTDHFKDTTKCDGDRLDILQIKNNL